MSDRGVDPVTLEIIRNQFGSVAEETGQVLVASSYSPNIKERRDCSTALFDTDGRPVTQAEHIPIRLGAIPRAVDTILNYGPGPSDVLVLNDPFEDGTRLPGVTMVSPLSVDGEAPGYAVSQAHRADIGGMTSGSMPVGAREIYQEELRFPPVKLVVGGETNDDVLSLLPANVRNPNERRTDVRTQLAVNERAKERLADLVGKRGRSRVLAAFDAVMDYSRNRATAELRGLSDGEYHACNVPEGDGVTDDDIPVEVTTTVDGDAVVFDFGGTADQIAGSVNAPLVVAKSAVYFIAHCVTDPEIPPNQGCYGPIPVEAPDGSLLSPDAPAAAIGGNVEASQRVTDVVFTALADTAPERIPAQRQGTMDNLTIGSRVGGSDGFIYYETIGGGLGGHAGGDGMGGVQVGMTSTLGTPVEALGAECPLFIEAYGLREGNGSRDEFHGGLGIVRSVTVEADTTVSLLTERRRVVPHGTAGGEDGATEQNLVGSEAVPSKTTRGVPTGITTTVRTPGDGDYGDPDGHDADARRRGREDGKAE